MDMQKCGFKKRKLKLNNYRQKITIRKKKTGKGTNAPYFYVKKTEVNYLLVSYF